MDQVLFLMRIMDSLIHRLVGRRRGELISMLKILRVKVRKLRVLRINHWIEMKRIRTVGMTARGKMMIVRVKLFKPWKLIRLIMYPQIWKIKKFNNNKLKWINLIREDKKWLIHRNPLLPKIWCRFKCKMMNHRSQTLIYQMVIMNQMMRMKVMMINRK